MQQRQGLTAKSFLTLLFLGGHRATLSRAQDPLLNLTLPPERITLFPTQAPTAATSTGYEWECTLTKDFLPNYVVYGAWTCFNLQGASNLDLNENLFDVYYCDIPLNLNYNLAETHAPPTLEQCSSVCFLIHPSSGGTCSSCELLASGNLAYDCENLFPQEECADRDASGECREHSLVECQPDPVNGGKYGKYLCTSWDRTEVALGLDPSLPDLVPYFFCDDLVFDTASAVTSGSCSHRCILQLPDASGQCNYCTVLDNGEYAYDCTNLFPDNEECAARDTNGNCGEYLPWQCVEANLGDGVATFDVSYYFCIVDFPWFGNPAFDNVDDRSGTALILYCKNDITGKSDAECESALCEIIQVDDSLANACNDCQVLPNGQGYSYDCLGRFPNMTCPVLLPDGTCSNTTTTSYSFWTDNSKNGYLSFWPVLNSEDLLNDTTKDSSSDASRTWLLKLDPTVFNVISDIVGYLTRFALGVAIASLYPVYATWSLKNRRRLPLDLQDGMPGDFVAALLALARLSIPGILIALLLAFADFSHTMADTGLDFVVSAEAGVSKPVLVLAQDVTNQKRPYAISGDPTLTRTSPQTTVNGRSNIELSNLGDLDGLEALFRQDQILQAYRLATSLIARGGSPFAVAENDREQRALGSIGGLQIVRTDFVPGDGSLSSIPAEIPLNCRDNEMVHIQQRLPRSNRYEPMQVSLDAAVPNCTYDSPRSSGIYRGNSDSIDVLETGFIPGAGELGVFLRKNESEFIVFSVTAAERRLARDRDDWRSGRTLSAVDGIKIGNVTIDFGAVVMASGLPAADDNKYYGVLAEVTSDCPARPSGLPSPKDTDCLVYFTVLCNAFPEDSASFYNPDYLPSEPTECNLFSVGLVWGRGFLVDAELVATMAGMYGLTAPSMGREETVFLRSGVLAANFALGTLDERPSISEQVRPQVNLVYVIFMVLPLAVWLLIPVAVYMMRDYVITIPQSKADFMVLAKEADDGVIEERPGKAGPFRLVDSELELVFHDSRSADDIQDIKIVKAKSSRKAETKSKVASSQGSTGNENDKDEEVPTSVCRVGNDGGTDDVVDTEVPSNDEGDGNSVASGGAVGDQAGVSNRV